MLAGEIMFLYGESVPRCTHHIDKFFEDYFTLQYMTGGAVELAIDGVERTLKGRWFWSAYPGPRIRFHVARGYRTWRHRYIAFRGELVEKWREQKLFPIEPQRAPAPAAGQDFDQRFDALLEHATRGDQLGTLRATHLLEGILIDLAEARAKLSTKDSWLEKALARMDAAVAGSSPDYDAIAADVGMAQRTLRRRFRAATGLGPHQYLLQARVAEARKLLGESDLPIKLIAQQLGYRDVYFFSRQFRQVAGVPPAVYRKSRQR